MRSRWFLVLLMTAVGCSSAPEPAPRPTGGALLDWSVNPASEEIQGLEQRCVDFAHDPACIREMQLAATDLAYGLNGTQLATPARGQALDPEDPRIKLGQALEKRRAAPAEAERLARESAEALGDRPLGFDARLLAAELAIERGEMVELPALPADANPAQRVQSAVLEIALARLAGRPVAGPWSNALDLASRLHHHTALLRLEALRESGVRGDQPPAELHAWFTTLARSALDRGNALLALQHATSAARAGEALPDALSRARDRLLVVRANVLAGKADGSTLALLDEAVEGASQVREAAPGPRVAEAASVVADARALQGEVLLAMGRPEDAADAFGKAVALFAEANDEPGRFRQALNQVTAWMKLGKMKEAEAALAALGAAPRTSEPVEGAELDGRRAVTAALLGLVRGAIVIEAAATRVEEALRAARDAGAWRFVEQYAPLPARLRAGPRPGR